VGAASPPAPASPSAPTPTLPAATPPDADRRPSPAAVDAAAGNAIPVPTAAPAPAPSAPGQGVAAAPSPGFAKGLRPVRATAPRRWRQPAAIAALLALLCLQIVLADRDRLAADAHWRPLVAGLCGMLGCSLPPWHQPEAFVLLSREVRPHPQRAEALRASASFRNDARWPQPWPRVLLTLSGIDGGAVAGRVFTPEEYLAGAPQAALIAPGQAVDISLDIREPATPTVSYAWDLL